MQSEAQVLPAVERVHAAAERLRTVLKPTRLLRSVSLSESLGIDVFLKCEFENPTGSFKIRGAYNVLLGMSDDIRQRGVVASSAGNHGLGVALAANSVGAPAFIYVPRGAPEIKKNGIRALGAQVDDSATDYDHAMLLAKEHSEREDIPFINPCLGVELLAGQGTVALEILDQCPTMKTIVVCTGGGGLLGGIGSVLRVLSPSARIVAAQSEQTAAMSRSVSAGKVVYTPVTPTLADGLAGQIDSDALTIGLQCADEFALVTEAEIGETIAWLSQAEGFTIEGAGAVAVAAIRYGKVVNLAGPLVATLSGRNIDKARHEELLHQHI